MYLSAQGSNSVEQAAHSFLATADVALPNAAETNPAQLAAAARWEAVLAAVPAEPQPATTAEQHQAVFMRTCALLALNRMKSAVVELGDALDGDVAASDAPPSPPLPLPLLLLRAYTLDASAATEGLQQECTNLRQVSLACWAVVDGGVCPAGVDSRAHESAAALSPQAALAWGCKAALLCSTLWMQAHQQACDELGTGAIVPNAAVLQRSAAAALYNALSRVWDGNLGQVQLQWQGEHALAALTCAVAVASSLVRVYLHCGQLQAAVAGQQLLAQLERAAQAAGAADGDETAAVLQLIRASVLACDATVSLAQGNSAIALAEAEEADTAAVAAGSQGLGTSQGTCALADGQALHTMAQHAVRSSCSCLCMAGSVLAGKAWAGMRAGNQLIASNAPAHMGMSRAICSNVTTMYDLTSTKTDAQFAREVLTHVASKYQLAQVLQGGWIKTI